MATATPKPMVQDGTEIRQMTETEFAQYQQDLIDVETETALIIAKAAARQAVLDKLGLTADEAAALLG